MSRFRIPLERTRDASEGLGWSSQVSGLTAAVLFLFLAGGGVFVSSHAAPGLAAKTSGKLTDHGVAAAGKESALRADFVEAIGRSLKAAGVDASVDANAGVLRLGPGSVSFKVGQAWLIGRPLEEIDRVGAVLEKASACLASGKSRAQAAPSVLDTSIATRSQACSEAEALASVNFACKPAYAALALDTILVEGHADGRPYAQPGRQFRDNLNLSSARGETVMRRLYACTPGLAGLANGKGQPLVGVASHSTQRPLTGAEPTAEANRRVEFRFVLGTAGAGTASGAPAATQAVGAKGAAAAPSTSSTNEKPLDDEDLPVIDETADDAADDAAEEASAEDAAEAEEAPETSADE